MNPFIRPTRSLLTCKNKSNIFHYVLLGLYNAATTVVCFKNVTSHNCLYCFLAWFSFPLFFSFWSLYCLFQLSLFVLWDALMKRIPLLKVLLSFMFTPYSNTTLLSQLCFVPYVSLAFLLVVPIYNLSLCWPVWMSAVTELQSTEILSTLYNLLLSLVWQIV